MNPTLRSVNLPITNPLDVITELVLSVVFLTLLKVPTVSYVPPGVH